MKVIITWTLSDLLFAQPRFSLQLLLSLLILSGGLTGTTSAQTITTTSTTDGKTPSALAPGAPAGSYALSGFENINLFNGAVNFRLPLLQVGGRGAVGYTMMLPIERKWQVKHTVIDYNIDCPRCEQHLVTHTYQPTDLQWGSSDLRTVFTPGVLEGRYSGNLAEIPCAGSYRYTYTLTRLTFKTADGTEYELRDQLNEGKPLQPTSCTSGPSRGTIFKTADGSSATFISDAPISDRVWPSEGLVLQPSGHLFLRDGTRYRIINGKVTVMRDRNGNQLEFDYSTGDQLLIKDSLNRRITVTFANGATQISFKGAGGATRTIRIWGDALSNRLRPANAQHPAEYLATYRQLFPTLDGSDETYFDPPVVSAVELPDGRQYQFYYNSYGELAKVSLPTGGAMEYDYQTSDGVISLGGGTPEQGGQEYGIYRRAEKRRVYRDDGALESSMEISGHQGSAFLVRQLDQSGQLLSASIHYFYGSAAPSLFTHPMFYSFSLEGKEYKTEKLAADGVTVLQRIEHTWQQREPISGWQQVNFGPEPDNDPRVVETVTTLADANLVSKQTFGHDLYNNQTDVYEYGFGAGAPGPLIRRTHTDHVTLNNGVNYAADTNIHIRNLPLQTQVFDAGGTKRAETFYEYDNYNSVQFHAPLTDRPNISGHDGAFWAGYIMRGNVTKTSRALLNNSGGVTGWVNSHSQYDIAGNVVKAIDAKGNETQLDFSDNFGSPGDPMVQSGENPANNAPGELGGQISYAFPFKITSALVEHKAYTKYDYYLGRPVLSEDINNIKSSVYFNDDLDRPTKGVRAIGTAVASQTVIIYNDSGSPVNGNPARSITTISDKDVFGESNSGNGLKSVALYDGLGRTWRTAAYEGSTWSITDTEFDALSRVSQVSNPYRAADPGSASPPSGTWTTTDYDALGRVTSVTTPDGAHVDTAYNGNQVTVTDQAGKKRRSKTNALGHLVQVVEDPDGVAYQTDYSYDTLGNLTVVNQGGQFRYFFYDSFGRLTRAKNPEQSTNSSLNLANPPAYNNNWSTAYSYDANGNLVSKTDARNITTNYDYDELNRATFVNYSDTAVNPDITRQYDNPDPLANGKGRFWRDYAEGHFSPGQEVEHTAIDGYDALGRPLTKRQQFKKNGVWSGDYSVSHTYDLAGAVTTLTYPSGRTVNYSYDGAGRLSSFTGNLGDGQLRTYSTITQHHPAGMIERETFGTQTPLHHKKRYNNRLQLGDLRLSTGSDALSYDRGALLFLHGPNAVANTDPFANDPTNNGNLVKQLHYVPIAGGGEVIPQADNYTYDALNRISGVIEPNVFTQIYGYDQWGNRRITSATGGVNNYNPTYDPGNNRIVGPSYDEAGNITSDVLTGGTMIYDAENRLLTASAGGGGTYTYDADGRRTRRTAGGQETWHIYGVGGELLAEYAANAQPTAPQKEYGYRGGQLLIIAESGSGGGVSFVKPASESIADIGGQAGPGLDGNTDELFEVDESVADLEFDEDSGSTTADVSSNNDTGMLIDGVARTTAEGYSNAPSANGVGGALLAEYPPAAAPSAPQKEYGYRGGRSIVVPLSFDVVSVSPSTNQSPDPGYSGDLAVNSPLNTEHAMTEASDSSFGPQIQARSCLWSAFQPVSGQITKITLKFNWSTSGYVSMYAPGEIDSASAYASFNIFYSTDNGSSWATAIFRGESGSIIFGPGGEDKPFSDFGSFSVDLPANTPINQIRVSDRLYADASASGDSSVDARVTATVSQIRLEVETDTTAPVISSIAAGGITTSSATITWNTNENSDSQVEYKTSTGSWQSTTLNPALVTAHSQGLSGLTPGTLYHYRVKSRDAGGNLAFSGDFTFTTAPPPDTTAPVISNVVVGGITTSGATITWNTNENSDSQVEYKTSTGSWQSTTLNPLLVTAHSQVLSGLTAGTLYHYRVKSKDAAGNLAVSGDFTFTTAQNGSAKIKWLVTDHLGSTRMVIGETGGPADITRHDYAPFGEELFAGVGIRTTEQGYVTNPQQDGQRVQFTGKERDIETGLDFMEARYYGSVMGRFTSVDPFDPILGKQGADDKEEAEREFRQYLLEPARWNRYVYALNNPLRYTDPDGMNPITVNLNIIYDERSNYTDEEKKRIRETYVAQAKQALGNVDINFNITETTGTASNLINDRATITTGRNNDALNVFFTKDRLSVFNITEKTDYKGGNIFVRTEGGADPRDLTHGIIHALGINSDVYGNYTKAEVVTEYVQFSLSVLNRRPSYIDNRPLYSYYGYAQAKAGSLPERHDVRSAFDVIRDGAQRYK